MAEVIVTGNLNTDGNNGQFETDRSTWGFGDTSDFEVTRSTDHVTAGMYGAKVRALTNSGLPTFYATGAVRAFFFTELTKRYLVKAQVYVPTDNPISDDTAIISFKDFLELPGTYAYVNKTVLEAKGNWVQIEARIHVTNLAGNVSATVGLMGTGASEELNGPGVFGLMYVDQLEVYEYIITDDPPETCDVEIDPDATSIINETSEGAADGSIEVEATGTGTLEYSKDGGGSWQLSNLFTGLTTGTFIVRVRKVSTPSCYDEHPFDVNFAAPTHDFTTEITNESISGLHDGSISVNVTGTGGPFEFSKDGGATWQAGNNFTDLAPGTYYIAVKNDDGNSVVKVAVITAGTLEVDNIYHSKNPITFSKGASSGWELLSNYRLYNDARVEDVADSGGYNSKLKVELPPDDNDQATFYLPEAFRGAFTFVPPTLNHNSIIRLTDRIKRFKNYSGELQDDEITPDEGDLEVSPANLVLWGGVSKFHFPGLNFFTDYLPTKKKFLTWAPVEKYVDRQQEDYLNFWNYGNNVTLKLQIKVYFDDATNETEVVATLTGTKFAELYQVPAGPANCGALLINPAKNATHYELSLLNQDDTVITEVRTYYVEAVSHPLTKFIMFINSLGSFEVLRFTGQATESTKFNRELVQKFLPHNYAALDGQFVVNQITSQKQTTLSSGYFKNRFAKEWHEYMKDFMGSPIVYDVTNGSRYPMPISAGDHISEDQNYELFIRVDARDGYDNDSFTPAVI
jgi:hypothetical protein